MKRRQRFTVAAASLFLALVTLALTVVSAAEDPYATALALYKTGDYEAAVAAAGHIGSAEGHALAARALLAKAAADVPYGQRLGVLKAAEAEADAAITANVRVIEGHLQKLIAFGYLSRMPGFGIGDIAAARISRQILDRALDIEPDNPWALASLGGWNLEIAKRAPLGVGRLMFGATRAKGIKAYERALWVAPDNVVIRYEYGLALLWLDSDADRPRAAAVLSGAIALKTDDAYGRFLQHRAGRLLALLSAKDSAGLRTVISAYRGEGPATDGSTELDSDVRQ